MVTYRRVQPPVTILGLGIISAFGTSHDAFRDALVEGRTGKDSLQAGRLGRIEVRGSEVILGKPFIFNKGNIDQYDF